MYYIFSVNFCMYFVYFLLTILIYGVHCLREVPKLCICIKNLALIIIMINKITHTKYTCTKY